MYKILTKKILNPTVVMMEIEAPLVAKKAKPGQFIILRVSKDGERIPLTISSYDEKRGAVGIVFQIVGATTKLLGEKKEGEYISDFAGPLGNPTKIEGLGKVLIVGGGVGCAIALPVAKALSQNGADVTSVIGFRNKDLVIFEEEFNKASNKFFLVTDDGSCGEKGNVCMPIERMLKSGEKFDEVIAIGPVIMMKFAVEAVKPYGIPCTVSMNPIMIDGTGMCGGCRLSVTEQGERKVKFACVDGPDFDGYTVDFDELMSRNAFYRDFEKNAYEKTCNLFKEAK